MVANEKATQKCVAFFVYMKNFFILYYENRPATDGARHLPYSSHLVLRLRV